MENVLIAIGIFTAVGAFEVFAAFYGSDSRDKLPPKNSEPELGPGHRPVWF